VSTKHGMEGMKSIVTIVWLGLRFYTAGRGGPSTVHFEGVSLKVSKEKRSHNKVWMGLDGT
jgi:hypothetical protein